MTLEQVKLNLWTYDFEVYAHDWLVVFTNYITKKAVSFHNDCESVVEFLRENYLISMGYNNKHYDQYILKGVLSYYDPERIKEINDYIIAEGQQGWSYKYENAVELPNFIDLMDDIVPRKSLKMLEGAMGLNIVETSIPFDHPTPWTDLEKEEIEHYCKHDNYALIPLFDARKGYLEAKLNVAELGDLEPLKALQMTNAKLTAAYLHAEVVSFNDERNYKYPDNLDLTKIPQEVQDFFNQLHDPRISDDDIFNMSLEISIADVEHKFGWGGLHGAVKNYIGYSKGDKLILNFDFDSYYPHLMVRNGYESRAIKRPKGFFEEVLKTRIKAKKEKNKIINEALKLILNTTYGAMLEKFNPLYDPLMGRSVCITGQLYLTMLITILNECVTSFKLIQTNTDGIMFEINKNEHELVRLLIEEFIAIVKINMSEDVVEMVAQKDVNNYVALINGELKVKGGYVSDYDYNFSSRNLVVVARAIVEYFKSGTDPAETINTCTDIFDFQMVQKVGSTYDKVIHETIDGKVPLQRTNRIYASTDKRLGKVKKVKINGREIKDKDGNVIGYADRYDTLQNCPPNAIVDNGNILTLNQINKAWYIDLAKKRIKDFEGSNSKMDDKNIMVVDPTKLKKDELVERLRIVESETSAAVTSEGEKIYPGVIGKIHTLRHRLHKHEWVKDGYNPQTKSDYIQAAQYKYILNLLCLDLDLEYEVEIGDVMSEQVTIGNSGKSIFWASLDGKVLFTDLETGDIKIYPFHVESSDTLDKALIKCHTLIAKSIIQTQFLVSDKTDEFSDEDMKAKTEKGKFISTNEQKKITKNVVSVENESTGDSPQKSYALELFDKIRKAKGKAKWSDAAYQNVVGDKLTSAKLQALILSLEEVLEGLDGDE